MAFKKIQQVKHICDANKSLNEQWRAYWHASTPKFFFGLIIEIHYCSLCFNFLYNFHHTDLIWASSLLCPSGRLARAASKRRFFPMSAYESELFFLAAPGKFMSCLFNSHCVGPIWIWFWAHMGWDSVCIHMVLGPYGPTFQMHSYGFGPMWATFNVKSFVLGHRTALIQFEFMWIHPDSHV